MTRQGKDFTEGMTREIPLIDVRRLTRMGKARLNPARTGLSDQFLVAG